jgi:ornithine carbamoyltransferase
VKFGFNLRIACPSELRPDPALFDWAASHGGSVELMHDPVAAVRGADGVVTDCWISMGDDEANRHNILAPFRVDDALMSKAKDDAVFLHCLPAHRGEEVTAEVIDGPRSLVWDEAENRLHTQKAILAWCLS